MRHPDENTCDKPGDRPAIDLGACTFCGGCVEIAPEIFRLHPQGGYVEVCELDDYDPVLVQEAIMYCPEDAIAVEGEESS
jgi:ferredoxin